MIGSFHSPSYLPDPAGKLAGDRDIGDTAVVRDFRELGMPLSKTFSTGIAP